MPLFTQLPRRGEAVEKVLLGRVGGSKEARKNAKTLQTWGLKPLNSCQKATQRSFSTRWGLLGNLLHRVGTTRRREEIE